ncbi:hypothetical protein [Stenotrophomonas sp. YIM B06876]|nr:hypothetical protein [Stenotrophomonas sp. YIM B06876]
MKRLPTSTLLLAPALAQSHCNPAGNPLQLNAGARATLSATGTAFFA